MWEVSKGILLKKIQYADSRYILKVLTPHEGVCAYSIRISSSRKSAVRNLVGQPMACIEMTYYNKATSEIRAIKTIHIDEPFVLIPHDVIRQSIALFMNEMVLQTIKLPVHDRMMYDFLKSSLQLLDTEKLPGLANFPLWFALRLALKLGIGPKKPEHVNENVFDLISGSYMPLSDMPGITLTPQLSQKLRLLMDTDVPPDISMARTERMALMHFMIDYFAFHADFDAHIKSADVLSLVFQ